jgi:DNA-binding winged helix-turn-helix (wHTH) protein
MNHQSEPCQHTLTQDSAHDLVRSLLRRLDDAPELRLVWGLLPKPTDRLARHAREQRQLLPTLAAYLDSGCSVRRTSMALGVHRNSVRYRLQRISERLGLDLADPDARLLVQMALRAGGGARPEHAREPHVRVGEVILDLDLGQVSVAGRRQHLTPTEAELLRFLIAHTKTPLSCQTILDAIWGRERHATAHTVHVYINGLRRKLETDPRSPEYLVTDTGGGYRLRTS